MGHLNSSILCRLIKWACCCSQSQQRSDLAGIQRRLIMQIWGYASGTGIWAAIKAPAYAGNLKWFCGSTHRNRSFQSNAVIMAACWSSVSSSLWMGWVSRSLIYRSYSTGKSFICNLNSGSKVLQCVINCLNFKDLIYLPRLLYLLISRCFGFNLCPRHINHEQMYLFCLWLNRTLQTNYKPYVLKCYEHCKAVPMFTFKLCGI